jgi:hypothetical protein
MKKNRYVVQVIANHKEDRVNFDIGIPKEQHPMDIKHTAHILAGGISLLIKHCDVNDLDISGADLLKEIIVHLETEFVSTESFYDAKSHIYI